MSTLVVTNLQAPAEAASTSVKANPKSWSAYDQTLPAIRDSLNVSSMTDDGVGDYRHNLTSAMDDVNFCVQGTGGQDGTGTGTVVVSIGGADMTASVVYGLVDDHSAANVDRDLVFTTCIGLLA